MRMDKLTSKFQMALQDAQSLAVGRDNQFIEPVHLMAALLDQDGGSSRHLLAQADVNVNRLRSSLGEAMERLPRVEGSAGEVHVGNDLGRLLNQTDKLAQQRKDQYISSELFVLAAVEDRGELGRLMREAGASKGPIERAIDQMRGGQAVSDPNAEEQRQALEKFTIDLTERAEQGKLDPVIGRDDEIRRTIQVLQRRTKNNPVLIGEPGVGKTAIVEGLAQRIGLRPGGDGRPALCRLRGRGPRPLRGALRGEGDRGPRHLGGNPPLSGARPEPDHGTGIQPAPPATGLIG